jgi:hypothetical protein
MPLRNWSLARVLLTSVVWFVLSTAGCLYFSVRASFAVDEGSGGIGAVSVGLNPITLAIPVVPAVLLIVAWLLGRWSKSV